MDRPRAFRKVSPVEAIALQKRLAGRVERADRLGPVRHVCGIDVHYSADGRFAHAAAAVFSFPALEAREHAFARKSVSFPYIPGLLSFRELPAALAALAALSSAPDLPCIGVAKTRFVGEHRRPPARRGTWAPLLDAGERVGAVLRTRAGVKPVYVSIGHRVSLETAVRYVMACTTRYRLPEPLRSAHRLARAAS